MGREYSSIDSDSVSGPFAHRRYSLREAVFRCDHPDAHGVVARECPLWRCLRPKHSLGSRPNHRKIVRDGTSGVRGRCLAV